MIYPLTPPTTPAVQEISWNLLSVTAIQASPFTLRTQVVVWPGQKFGFVATLPQMSEAAGKPWTAFFAGLQGNEGTFLFGPSPIELTPAAAAIGLPETVGTTNGHEVISTGWTPNVEVAKPGAWVSIYGKLRKVRSLATSDADGNATLDVWPALADVPTGTEIVWLKPMGEFRLSDEAPEMILPVSRYYPAVTFAAIETDA